MQISEETRHLPIVFWYGWITRTVFWPITRSDRTETLNGQSISIIYNRATSLGVQNKDSVAVSQTEPGFSSDAAQAIISGPLMFIYRERYIGEYEVRECITHTWVCSRVNYLKLNVCLEQAVIFRNGCCGFVMASDVFVAATSESTESDTFVEEWESTQREVMTDSPGRVDFPSW